MCYTSPFIPSLNPNIRKILIKLKKKSFSASNFFKHFCLRICLQRILTYLECKKLNVLSSGGGGGGGGCVQNC